MALQFITLSQPNFMLCFSVPVAPQDEFRRWFLAKVRVMLAPGRSPFHILDTQTTTTSPFTPSPDTTPTAEKGPRHQTPEADPGQELIRRYGEYQPTQVSLHRFVLVDSVCNISHFHLFTHTHTHPNQPLFSSALQIRYFTHHSAKYYWNEEAQNFEVLT